MMITSNSENFKTSTQNDTHQYDTNITCYVIMLLLASYMRNWVSLENSGYQHR